MAAPTRAPGAAAGTGPSGSVYRDPAYLAAMAVAVVVALGFGLVVPVLPLLASAFGVSVFAATFVVTAFAGVRLVSNLFAGRMADRIGSRRAVAYGAFVVGVSSALAAAAPSYWWLVLGRGVGGFGSALFFTALLSHVIGLVPPDQRGRAVGGLQGAFLFGLTAGPFAGGPLAEPLGLRGPFVVYAAACGLAGIVALVLLPPVRAGAVPQRAGGRGLAAAWATTRLLAQDGAFVAALVMMAVSRWSATGVRFSLVPLFAEDVVGLAAGPIGVALGVAAVAQLLVLWPVGRATDLYGRKTVSVPAFGFFAVTAALLAVATSPVAFVAVLALYGAATGLTSVTPPAVVADVVPPEHTGVGVGALNTAGDLGSVLGPLVSGALVDLAGYGWGFGIAAAFLLLGAVAGARMRETLPAAPAP